MARQIGGAYQQAATAALEERISMLEGRLAALADAVGILARGLEDLPTAEPGQRRTAEAARRAQELLPMTELRPPAGRKTRALPPPSGRAAPAGGSEPREARMPGILVGVDGSDHSRRALAWAMHEAAQRHVPLTVMTVRPDPPPSVTQIYWNVPKLSEKDHELRLEREAVRRLANEVARETGETAPDLIADVTAGDPAEELVKASRHAGMLVVGSRDSGVFAGLLMGSVTSKVVHHAACPVVVIPGPR